jgi:hypothetical protein
MVKFEVHMNSKISKGMIHFNVQAVFYQTMWDMYPFLNNVGSTITGIIWKFDHKFIDQIMFPRQFVEPLEHCMILFELW